MVNQLVLSREKKLCASYSYFWYDIEYIFPHFILQKNLLSIIFSNVSLLTVGQPVQPKMQFLLIYIRSLTNGNCMTSIELFLNPDY